MAASMRKYAKSEGLNVTISAVSKSEIMDYADKIDVLLLGPHFASEVPAVQEQVSLMALRSWRSILMIMQRWMERAFSKTLSICMKAFCKR